MDFFNVEPNRLGGILTISTRVETENNCNFLMEFLFMNLWIFFSIFSKKFQKIVATESGNGIWPQVIAKLKQQGCHNVTFCPDFFNNLQEDGYNYYDNEMYQAQNFQRGIQLGTYIHLSKHPDDLFSKHVIGFSLYGLSMYANKGEYKQVSIVFNDIEGQLQQVYHFLEKTAETAEELNVLAIRYNWELYKLDTSDKQQEALCDTLLREFTRKYRIGPKHISSEPMDISLQDSLNNDLIKQYPEIPYTVTFGLIDQMNDSIFVEKFEKKFNCFEIRDLIPGS